MTKEKTPTVRTNATRFEATVCKMFVLEQMLPELVGDEMFDEHAQNMKIGVRALFREINSDLADALDTMYAHEFKIHRLEKSASPAKGATRLTVANSAHG